MVLTLASANHAGISLEAGHWWFTAIYVVRELLLKFAILP